ncbi:hypothetical protein ACIBCM_18505 [Streptomyces sp. NPDC051018]|uniref:hypothetical protein n=1 Tax=Streptomyces sp. NPDC051018 TaxID=3365639 RepID=UPI00379FCC36
MTKGMFLVMGEMRKTLPIVSAAVAMVLVGLGAGAVSAYGASGVPSDIASGVASGVAPEAGAAYTAAGGQTGGAYAGAVAIVPQADVSHHGRVTLAAGRLGVVLESRSHGPSGVANATVKLAFSTPLAAKQQLPSACLRASGRVVLCTTGPLRAGGAAHRTVLGLRTAGAPDEVVVKITTPWKGGATDRNPSNDQHQVLALATGDPYAF